MSDLTATVRLVPITELLDLAKLGQAMRRAQGAFFRARRLQPHVPADDLFMAARAAEARFDQAVAAAMKQERERSRPGLPGIEEGGGL